MNSERISELIRIYKDGLADTVGFWTEHGVDHEYGGFLTFLDRDGSVFGTDKPVWLEGRCAWVFAKLYNEVEKRQEWLELSKHGLDFLSKHCFDEDGRMYFLTTRDGKPLRMRRYLFSESFAAIAFAEYAKATGNERAKEKACSIYDLMLLYHFTPGLLEPKVIPETRQMISHSMEMILIGTSQVLRQIDKRSIYNETIDGAIDQIVNRFCKPELNAMLENVGPNGEFMGEIPEGRTVLPGHCIESAWFIMEEGRYRNDKTLIDKGLQILDWSINWGWDKEFGGIIYYRDVLDKPCVQYEWDMKLWWPHTESLYAMLLAYHLTGDKKWEDWYEKIHEYTFSHFPDPEYGEWFGYLHRDGTVAHRLKGNCWKGLYHLPRAQLLCRQVLEEMKEKLA